MHLCVYTKHRGLAKLSGPAQQSSGSSPPYFGKRTAVVGKLHEVVSAEDPSRRDEEKHHHYKSHPKPLILGALNHATEQPKILWPLESYKIPPLNNLSVSTTVQQPKRVNNHYHYHY